MSFLPKMNSPLLILLCGEVSHIFHERTPAYRGIVDNIGDISTDVANVHLSVTARSGEDDSEEEDFAAILELTDGRFVAVTGHCGSTGWDGRSEAVLTFGNDYEDVLMFGLDEDDRRLIERQRRECLQHEDCRASFTLGKECYAQRAKKGSV